MDKPKQDKCYHCGSTEHVGIETATKRIVCAECAVAGEQERRKEAYRRRELAGGH